MVFDNWKPIRRRTLEDKLLLNYWLQVGGLIFTEVLFGRGFPYGWPEGSLPRRIDAVRIIPPHGKRGLQTINVFKQTNASKFSELVNGAVVEAIEIKEYLDRRVIGQALVGVDLIEMFYKPRSVVPVALVKVGDPLLEQVCRRRKIKVELTNSQ